MALPVSSDVPHCFSVHDIGRIRLGVNNQGYIGVAPPASMIAAFPDCITGNVITRGSEFPKNSLDRFILDGGLWFGGILGGDTLVTTAADFENFFETTPELVNGKPMDARSSLDSIDARQRGAISEQDRIVCYTDTFVDYSASSYDYLDHRPHKPLGLKVTQESYAWSYSYAEDIVFFNVQVQNIGKLPIRDAYVALYVQLGVDDVVHADETSRFGRDDITGFLDVYPSGPPCDFEDTVDLAWGADNDGDPFNGEWLTYPVRDPQTGTIRGSNRHALGAAFLTRSRGDQVLSYNWWVSDPNPAYDWGPMRSDDYRDFRNGSIGTPEGDRNRYYEMRNGETDYDQVYTAVMQPTSGWISAPPNNKANLADGGLSAFLLSLGPADIGPGATYSFAFCLFGGENFHVDPNNIDNLPYNPDRWLQNVDFSDLAKNAVWAQKIYDNPGYDTDGDGYAGEFRVCNYDSEFVNGGWQYTKADTEWYKGDGVPDWRAAGPPPPPDFWLTPIHNGIKVRFNGEVTETAKDALTQKVDFEGYRIYIGRDDRETSYSLVASYDLKDYDKLVFNPNLATGPAYELWGTPFTMEQLRCLYGSGPDPCTDSSFDPLSFSRTRPYILPGYPDSVFIFEKHEFNASDFGVTTPIKKIYPNYPNPHEIPADSITPDMYTDDGYFKYYEYEFTIENLLPTVPYWVNVTAFDFGSPGEGLSPLESSKTLHAKSAFPLHDLDEPVSGSGKIYVYPNPYRIDADYRGTGYEGRTHEDRSDDRVRAIWFGNLPPKCTIKIFTLDGDRVRTIEHDYPPGDPMANHDYWDLINRNMQRVVSGLYYWTVETPDEETQIGKLVIIR